MYGERSALTIPYTLTGGKGHHRAATADPSSTRRRGTSVTTKSLVSGIRRPSECMGFHYGDEICTQVYEERSALMIPRCALAGRITATSSSPSPGGPRARRSGGRSKRPSSAGTSSTGGDAAPTAPARLASLAEEEQASVDVS